MTRQPKAPTTPALTQRFGRTTPARRYRLIAGGAGIVILLAASFALRQFGATATAVPPDPDLSRASAEVATAVRQARETVLGDRTSGPAWGKLGMVLFAHQFEVEMIPCFEEAARLDRQDFRWPYFLGLGVAVSDPELAERSYREALARQGDVSVIHTRLAELLLAQQRFDEAGQHFRTAVDRDPQDARAFLGMARLALLCGDAAAAVPWAEHAAQLAPGTRDVHEVLAQLYQRTGKREAAVRELQEVARRSQIDLMWNDPVAAKVVELRRDSRWSLQQAAGLASEGRLRDAIHVLRTALAADDREPELYVLCGRFLVQDGKLGEAAELLQQGLKRHPEAAEIHFQRGVVAYLGGNDELADRAFRDALSRKPDYALAYHNLGHTRLRQQKWDDAAQAFRDAIRCRPDYVDAHINLARALKELGKNEEMITTLQTVLQLAPGNRVAQQLLEEATKKPSQ